jgi:hypothetical protein
MKGDVPMKLSRALVPRRWPRISLIAVLLVLAVDSAMTPVTETAASPNGEAASAGRLAPASLSIVTQVDGSRPVELVARDDGEEGDEEDGVTKSEKALSELEDLGTGSVVRLRNKQDGRMRIRGNVELNRIHGPKVTPKNGAVSWASCTDCQTVTVALQLNLYKPTATWVAPVNEAVAFNYECTRCATVAVAIQYALPVEDPSATPWDVDQLIREMDRELRDIHSDHRITVAEAETRLNTVIARFTSLANNLDQRRAEATEQTSPSLTPTATASASASSTPTATLDVALPAGAAVESTPTAPPTPEASGTPAEAPSGTPPAPAAAPPAPTATPTPSP